MYVYLFLMIAVIAEVIATTAMKASDGFTQLTPSIIVVIGYAIAFYFLSITMRTLPVGLVYATWSGVGIIIISIVSWLLYGQKLDLWGMIGMLFIITGVLMVNVLSKTSAH